MRLLAHGLGVQAIRANAKAGTLVGLAEDPVSLCPVIEDEVQIAACTTAMREENARFLTVVLEGKYTDAYLKRLEAECARSLPRRDVGDWVAAGLCGGERLRAGLCSGG